MKDKKSVHIFLSGRVQGVGFRAFIRRNAKSLNVNGWAKNLADGRVEAVFTGKKDKVNKLIALIKDGPQFAKVNNIEISDENNYEYDSFKIKY
ncbi:MAG: acylphosphatase [Bacillota bacterium]